MALISILSHQPHVRIPGGATDWFLHGAEFGLLALLAARAITRSGWRITMGALALVVVGCFGVGVLDEFHQSFIPGRHPSAWDVAADSGGAAIALLVLALLRGRGAMRGGNRGEVRLLGKADCRLCDEAERVLAEILPEYGMTFQKVDVDHDRELRRLYGEQIPVVLINGRKVFKYRVDRERLRRLLTTWTGNDRA
ncbi:MAG: VanZ family protein [Acidobacteriota bacterium]